MHTDKPALGFIPEGGGENRWLPVGVSWLHGGTCFQGTGDWMIIQTTACSVSLSQRFTGSNIVLTPFFLKAGVAKVGADLYNGLHQVMMRWIFPCQIWRSSWRRCERRRWTRCPGAAGLRWRSTPISPQRGPILWLLEGEWWAGPSPIGWRRRRGCEGQWRWWWWRRTWRWGYQQHQYFTAFCPWSTVFPVSILSCLRAEGGQGAWPLTPWANSLWPFGL